MPTTYGQRSGTCEPYAEYVVYGPTLFGNKWLEFIKLDWPVIKLMACDVNHNAILDKYPSLFGGGVGTF